MSSDCILRRRFIGLLLLITLTAAGLCGFSLYKIRHGNRIAAQQQLETRARLLASEMSLQIYRLHHALASASRRLAHRPGLVNCGGLKQAMGHSARLLTALRLSRDGQATTCRLDHSAQHRGGPTLSVPVGTAAGGHLQGVLSLSGLPELGRLQHTTVRLLDERGHVITPLSAQTPPPHDSTQPALHASVPIPDSHWRLELTRYSATPAFQRLDDTLSAGLVLLLLTSGALLIYGLRSARAHVPLPLFANAGGGLAETFHQVDRLLGSSCRYSRQQNAVQERLRFLLRHDTLTGLPNRDAFREQLIEAMHAADTHERLVALMILDLDRFKTVNDTLGHSVGDNLIEMVARRVEERCRENGSLAHLGGGEFGLVCPSAERIADVESLAAELLKAISHPFAIQGYQLHMTASIGIIFYPLEEVDYDRLIANAETAMFRAKREGRNRYQFYTAAMNSRALQRLVLENSLRGALERNEFMLHFQPQFAVDSGQVVGVEALIRWQHPEWGMVSPGEFITLLEETGMVVAVGRWVLHTACLQAAQWFHRYGLPLRVSVNLSVLQLRQRGLHQEVSAILEKSGLPAELLELELTESMLMEEAGSPIDTLAALRNTGVALAIDDFGTGYSSLSYLRRFPVDAIKIDRAFIEEMENDPHASTIVGAIIQLAHSLDFRVVAEGVEKPAQLELLRERDCDEVQGFLLGRPMPAESIERLLDDEQKGGRAVER